MNKNTLEALMTVNNGEDVCICGHFKIKHEDSDITSCLDCNLSMWIPLSQVCRQYKRDNLKYLEAKNKNG